MESSAAVCEHIYIQRFLKEAVDTAFRVLSKGGAVTEPIHELPWNQYCAAVIDRFGVCRWIAI